MKRILIFGAACFVASLLVLGTCPLRAEDPPQGSVGSGGGSGNLLCAPARAPLRASNSELWRPWVGVYTDETHGNQCLEVDPYQFFMLWVWWRPGSRGMNSAEFRIDLPASLDVLGIGSSSLISAESGTLETGVSIVFSECQTDWICSHTIFCMLTAPEYDVITVEPHPVTGSLELEACDSDHSTEWPFAFTLYYNACSMCPPYPKPAVVGVAVETESAIRAYIDSESFVCTGGEYKNNFFLVNAADSADTIHCIDAYWELLGAEWVLTLEREMTDGVAYQLNSLGLCLDAVGGYSKYEFTFHEEVATLLRSCSASFSGSGIELAWELSEVDAGIEFFVSRSENGADFIGLDMAGLTRDGLRFAYADSRVEPGESYVYKVEYSLDGASRLLFISEEIRTPAALLALEQNRPNPFNPSTMISFTLPAECAARLEVYDVSGRLVARLIDGGRRSAGPHDVEWNGRDVSGKTAASGIYIYRLIAGKETISRKMVLLR